MEILLMWYAIMDLYLAVLGSPLDQAHFALMNFMACCKTLLTTQKVVARNFKEVYEMLSNIRTLYSVYVCEGK